jgi:predicted dehydrogenase
MTQPSDNSSISRRHLLKGSSLAAGAVMLGGLPAVHAAADSDTIRLALIGCGSRGSGAVRDAAGVPGAQVKLYAMADLSERSVTSSHDSLKKALGDKVDVPTDRRFAGFDAYKHAIDLLRPGDVAMCTTRSYIRPVHVEYAVRKGINVFMEKPFASDPGGLHRLLRAGEEADKKGVRILAGLQCRHSPARQALIDRIRNGDMGEITLIRANRLGGGGWMGNQGARGSDLMSQLNFGRIHLFWIGSGHMADYLVHQIDECCWIKDAWPVSCEGLGGRVPFSRDHGQNIDVYSMEYTFADGTKAFCGFRRIDGTRGDFNTYIHGTKCAAQFSGPVHRADVHMFKNQQIAASNRSWTPPGDKFSPWQYEWNAFVKAIREDLPFNECRRAVYSDLTTLMGRAACHIGQTVTWEQMMASRFQFCDYLDTLSPESPAPVVPNENGQFPVPVPGKWKEV